MGTLINALPQLQAIQAHYFVFQWTDSATIRSSSSTLEASDRARACRLPRVS